MVVLIVSRSQRVETAFFVRTKKRSVTRALMADPHAQRSVRNLNVLLARLFAARMVSLASMKKHVCKYNAPVSPVENKQAAAGWH
jgi:hypothetical protein